jgi:hypothetical protein
MYTQKEEKEHVMFQKKKKCDLVSTLAQSLQRDTSTKKTWVGNLASPSGHSPSTRSVDLQRHGYDTDSKEHKVDNVNKNQVKGLRLHSVDL